MSLQHKRNQKGVSIITCTKRPDYMLHLFHNYSRQRFPRKELIIIVNHDHVSLERYKKLARKYEQVQVHQLPERMSLGACLNYAVNKAKYDYIAKFDDDDYYAPFYLTESLQAMDRAIADVVGKRAHYMYLNGSRRLILRFHKDENRYVSILPGATLVFKRSVFRKVQFPKQNVGEDDRFCQTCKARGFKVYSAGRHNFVAMRRVQSHNHTWKISDKELLAHHKTIPLIRSVEKFVERTPKGLVHE